MKKQKICPICNNSLEKGESTFAFPRLPASNRYGKLAGIVHVICLIKSSEAEDIRKELTEVLKHSPYPVISQMGNILILNHEKDKCFVIYDFEDFAIFSISYNLVSEILNTYDEKEWNLDVNGFSKLRIDNSLQLTILKPFSEEQIMLSCLPLKKLKAMFGDFMTKQKFAELSEIFIRILKLRSSASHYCRNQNIALPSSYLFSKINDNRFLNNNFRRGQLRYGTI